MKQTLPVVLVPQPETKSYGRRQGYALVVAQLIGQDGIKRGLRAGPQAIEAAQDAYRDCEYMGPYDRRLPAGSLTRTSA